MSNERPLLARDDIEDRLEVLAPVDPPPSILNESIVRRVDEMEIQQQQRTIAAGLSELRQAIVDSIHPDAVLGAIAGLYSMATDVELPPRDRVAASKAFLDYTVGRPGDSLPEMGNASGEKVFVAVFKDTGTFHHEGRMQTGAPPESA